jgi:hypothetical protein
MEPTEGAPNGQRQMDDNNGGRTFGQRVDRIGGTAQEAWTRTRDAVTDMKATLNIEERVDRNPYGMMAAALGVGYVLGGGIFSPLTARILGLGMRLSLRLAALPFIKEELMGIAESISNGSSEESGSKSRRAKQTQATNKGK